MKEWWPTKRLQPSKAVNYAIIILNVEFNEKVLDQLINNASLLICADAGADRFLAYSEKHSGQQVRLPDAIVGDLDSVSSATLQYYQSQSVVVKKDPDQYSSDLTKSLKWIRHHTDEASGTQVQMDVIVMGSLRGRVDQAFSQMHHLYMAEKDSDLLRGDMYLLSDTNITFLLNEGMNEIHIDRNLLDEACGVIPLAGKTSISMTGFEWDVVDWPTEFGGQMSTSQYIRSDLIKIEVKGPRPILTLELAKGLQD